MTANSRMSRRILHTSDLHLESFDSRDYYNFEAVVNLAVDIKPDLVLIAGDLFDSYKVDEHLARLVAKQLTHLPMHVVILPGNHDCLVPGSVYQEMDYWKIADNVRIFTVLEGETLVFPDLGISIWGKPIAFYDENFLPLGDIPQRQNQEQWNVAVAHGYYVDSEPPAFPSLNIRHEEIAASGQDYIALGHVPVFRCACNEPVKAYYSGSPSVSGTVAIVDLVDKEEVQITCHSL